MNHPSDDFGHDPEPPHDDRDAARGCIVWAVIGLAILFLTLVWVYWPSSQNESELIRKPRFVPASVHRVEP